jgi:predicted dienelactone hydrolase
LRNLVLALSLVFVLAAGAARAGNVGFTELLVPDGDARPLVVGVWYPTDSAPAPHPLGLYMQDVAQGAPVAGRQLPLVVFSHGTGGWYDEHYDTALALAHAGFVVAAVSHTGDTYVDGSRSTEIWIRAQQIRRLIDYMLGEWPAHAQLDPARVGMFGFSAGGFTTLVVAGGVPDLTLVAGHCQAVPSAFECGPVRKSGPDLQARIAALPKSIWVHDARVRAAVVAAPALGYTFGAAGLAAVGIPVQLWRAEDDHILPGLDYAAAVDRDLPHPADYHVVPNMDHFDFMAPCSERMQGAAADICASRPGFDRAAFHAEFDRDVVGFFEKTLAPDARP